MPVLILYNPPSNAQRKPVLPMSLLALGALLEEDHSYIIIDGNLEADPLATLDRAIRETGATVLGVTVMPGPQLSDAVPTCRELKRRHAELTVVWGGYFPTQHWEVCLRASYVDYVVRGHGEVVFKELLDTLKRGDDPAALPGIAYRHPQNGEPISNVEAPIPHPDQMPDFPYHRIPMERYIRPTFLGNRTLPHHASYGCPFFCNFCAVVNLVNGRWLAQSAERTVNTARQLVTRYGANAIEFYDNNAFTAEARISEFAERLLQMNLDIAWWGEARIDTMLKYKDRTWERMRDSGLKMVFLGAESGSNETLQRMNKGGKASTEKTLEIAQKMAHYDIVPEMSFVLGNPPDPEADIRQTINFIRQVKRINPATEIILYMYTPVPLAGELYEQAKAEGFQFPETLEGWISHEWQEFSQRRSITMPWLQDPVRRKIRNFQWVLNAYHPTTTDITMSWLQRTLVAANGCNLALSIGNLPISVGTAGAAQGDVLSAARNKRFLSEKRGMKQQMGKILRKLTAVCGYSLDRKPRAILRDRSRELAVTLDLLVAHLLTRQDQCIFVQIGAYDGISVDPMHPIIVKYGLQGVLVEPQPDAYAELCQTYAGTSGLELVNVAVAEQDGTRTLYRIKRRAEIPQGLHQLATFDRALLVRQLKMIGNVQAEIEEIFVPCLTVDQLLKRAGLGRVDLLYIDAEGYDYAIVKQFDVANRKPQIIGFEHRWLRSSELNECVDFLIFHGYKVAVDQQDTLAYRC